jgi:hypothetical protein
LWFYVSECYLFFYLQQLLGGSHGDPRGARGAGISGS